MSESTAIGSYYDEYWEVDLYPEGSGLAEDVQGLLEPHVAAGSRCIDVGCGNGRVTGEWLQDRAGSYVGVDVSSVAVEQARAIGLNAQVIDDAASLPFPDGSFDVAVCVEVLEHLLRPDFAVAEIARVLSPSGVLVVTVPNAVFWRRRTDLVLGRWNPGGDDRAILEPWRDPHLRFFTLRALEAMLTGAGFSSVQVGGHGGAFVRNLPAVRRLGRGGVSGGYRRLERRAPSLLAARLTGVARKRP